MVISGCTVTGKQDESVKLSLTETTLVVPHNIQSGSLTGIHCRAIATWVFSGRSSSKSMMVLQ
jgi:hypothetical protein